MEMSSCFSFLGVIWGSSSGCMVCGVGHWFTRCQEAVGGLCSVSTSPCGILGGDCPAESLLGGRSSEARQNKDLADHSLGFLIPYIEAEWTHS